ncbi:MAG: succinylglutamate desuccinylase/aspartoacylase family protein [Candidatus Competibacterales bacterium]
MARGEGLWALSGYPWRVALGMVVFVGSWLALDLWGDEARGTEVPNNPGVRVLNAPELPVLGQGLAARHQTQGEPAEPFVLLGETVAPGSRRTLTWSTSIGGFGVDTPVIVNHGGAKGPVVCLTAAVHGDELNGIEIARQVSYGLDPMTLRGTIVAVPVVNIEGFFRQSRYFADRRDLNRHFPGNPEGSAAGRLAFEVFARIIRHCDALADLHTGSYYRANLPQLRADMTLEAVAEMAAGFNGLTVLHSVGRGGMLRVAAVQAGIPAVTLEIGGPLRLEPAAVDAGVVAIRHYLAVTGLLPGPVPDEGVEQAIFFESIWLRAEVAGIFHTQVPLGEDVQIQQILGYVIDPITNRQVAVLAPAAGTVLGLADNQFVSPGYALYRLGLADSQTLLHPDTDATPPQDPQ